MKNHISTVLISLAVIIAAYLLGNAFQKRNFKEKTVAVTGLGTVDFTSDLIVWEGNIYTSSFAQQEAYTTLERDKNELKKYLTGKGIQEEQLIFSAVQATPNYKANYSGDGKYIGEYFTGYTLTQGYKVESSEVEKVEKISREVTELLNKGLQINSQLPRYYYTKLGSLKKELVSEATKDANERASNIAKNANASLGKLISANMGIFQITGQNSDEDYSWGGAFNTSSKKKTASITMKLVYGVK